MCDGINSDIYFCEFMCSWSRKGIAQVEKESRILKLVGDQGNGNYGLLCLSSYKSLVLFVFYNHYRDRKSVV